MKFICRLVLGAPQALQAGSTCCFLPGSAGSLNGHQRPKASCRAPVCPAVRYLQRIAKQNNQHRSNFNAGYRVLLLKAWVLRWGMSIVPLTRRDNEAAFPRQSVSLVCLKM